VACSSATAGLHLSAMVLGIGPGDRWWTTPNTFCATADAALRCGADVDFIDIEWGTYNMNLGLLEERLKQAARKNRLPKVVAPVHFAGNPVDMVVLNRLRNKYGFRVVEDAAHATGARFKGVPIGSCLWSDLCVFSFHAVKVMTTGEGGMVTTNCFKLYDELLRLRTHGISRDPKYRSLTQGHPWYYEKLELGNHYRMTDIQAALGRNQLGRIGEFLQKRRQIAGKYQRALHSSGLELPCITTEALSSWHLYVVTTPQKWGATARDQLLIKLRNKGIQANLHYTPVQNFAFYRRLGKESRHRNSMPCPLADAYGVQAISLPIFPRLKSVEQKRVIREIKRWSEPFRI